MSYLELTLPLDHEWMPDEVFPTAMHFYLGPKFHPDKGIVTGSESGTCLTLPALFAEFRKTMRIHEVPIQKLFLRPTTIVDVSKSNGEEIGADDIRQAVELAGPDQGDAFLIRTGWGDRALTPGGGYVLESPHFSLKAAEALASSMADKGSDLLLTDTALVGRPDRHLIPEWCSIVPRPGPWPSPEARVYLHLYTAEKAKEDFAPDMALARAGIMIVKKLVNCGSIKQNKVKIIANPLHVVRGVASTCRVIALQDQ